MPNRILRDGILRSPQVARLNWAEEVFYRRLHSVVDDFGTYYADPGLLRADCYPRHLGKVSDSDVEKWLRACVDAALVRVYPAEDGERYLQVLKFRQQVRAKESKFPQPSSECIADATQTPIEPTAPAHLGVSVSVSVDEGGKARKRATPLPADFGISDGVKAWAVARGFERLPEHLEAFRDKCQAKAYTYADWDRAFMGAIREDWAKLRGRTKDGAAPPSEGASKPVITPYIAPTLTPEEREASDKARKALMATVKRIAA